MASERTAALAVDVDHALARLLPAALEWHNATQKSQVQMAELATPEWAQQLAGDGKRASEWLAAFYASEAFASNVAAVEGALEALRPLRKYFTLLAVTQRPRSVEKATREWIDAHFRGVFDKLLFVDGEEGKDDVAARKKALFTQFRVKIAVAASAADVESGSGAVAHTVVVGSVPWAKPPTDGKALVAKDWQAAKETIENLAKEMALPVAKKVAKGPKIARYSDDLVSISMKKPAAFYASMVNTKFNVQKQASVRLQASEAAISTAVQAAELLKAQKHADVAKISTRYLSKKFRGASSHRVPAIEIVLHKIAV